MSYEHTCHARKTMTPNPFYFPTLAENAMPNLTLERSNINLDRHSINPVCTRVQVTQTPNSLSLLLPILTPTLAIQQAQVAIPSYTIPLAQTLPTPATSFLPAFSGKRKEKKRKKKNNHCSPIDTTFTTNTR